MVKTQRLRSIPSSKRQRLEKEGEGEGNRRKETESSEESESEDEVDIANNGDMENLSFSFSDFSPSFYDGVNLLVKQSIRLGYSSSMTQLVVDQEEVGTVVHCDGELDVFAFSSILPLVLLQANSNATEIYQCIDPLLDELSHRCNITKSQLLKSCGLMMSERFVNCPPPLLIELFANLMADFDWINSQSKDNKSPEDIRVIEAFCSMNYVLLVSPCKESPGLEQQLSDGQPVVWDECVSVELKREEDRSFAKRAKVALLMRLNQKLFLPQFGLVLLISIDDLRQAISTIA